MLRFWRGWLWCSPQEASRLWGRQGHWVGQRERPRAEGALWGVRVLWLGLEKGRKEPIWERKGSCIKEGPLELGFAGRVGVS